MPAFMILLDTSFLFAFFQEDDVHHAKAKEWAPQLDEDPGFIPMSVFDELMTLLTYRVSPEAAIKIGQLLLQENSPVGVLKMDETVFDEAWSYFQEKSPHNFSFTD